MLDEDGRYIHRIWRALDADTSFLGIRGRYMLLFGVTSAAGILVSLCTSSVTGSFGTSMLVIASVGAAYIATLKIQGLLSVRQFTRRIAGRSLCRHSKVAPQSIVDHFKNNLS